MKHGVYNIKIASVQIKFSLNCKIIWHFKYLSTVG